MDEVIKKLETDLKKARKKEAGEVDDGPVRSPSHHDSPPNICVTRPIARRAHLPTRRRPRRRRTSHLPLLTASHSTRSIQLDEEQLKEKKKQKLMKAGFEARVRARKEKEKEREEREEQERKEEEERDMDFGGWSRKLRQEQEVRVTLRHVDIE